jgi:hypothetical protein
MLWYVDPYQPHRAVNLEKFKSIKLKKYDIVFDSEYVWDYEQGSQAEAVYEAIIKLIQQTRYRRDIAC